MKIILAGSDKETLTRQAYPAFVAAGLDVVAVGGSPEELTMFAGFFPDAVAVVDAGMFPTPEEALTALPALAVRKAITLPQGWESHKEDFARLPGLVAGFSAPLSWPEVVGEIRARVGRLASDSGSQVPPLNSQPETSNLRPETSPRSVAPERRTVAFWSGPAGGTGRTTLSVALAMDAAWQGVDVCLLALSEPAVSVCLGLGCAPNATAFFETGDLMAATQKVVWEGHARSRPCLSVVLGPTRHQDGAVEEEQIRALLTAAQAAHALVVADLPPLVPGRNPWVVEPLARAAQVVLVLTPTTLGVAVAVEALGVLRDIGASGQFHLLLNQRSPGGLAVGDFVGGVTALWGSCPPVVAQVPYLPGLSPVLERGELPDLGGLSGVLAALEELTGMHRPAPSPGDKPDRADLRISPRRIGRWITVEVTD